MDMSPLWNAMTAFCGYGLRYNILFMRFCHLVMWFRYVIMWFQCSVMRFHHSVTWFRNGYMVSTFSYKVSLFGYAVSSFRYAVSSLCGSYALCASSPNKKGRFRKVFRMIFEKKKISKDIICELSLEDFRTLGFVDRNQMIQ